MAGRGATKTLDYSSCLPDRFIICCTIARSHVEAVVYINVAVTFLINIIPYTLYSGALDQAALYLVC